LITPQIAQEFSILKLDLKLGALPQAELVHSLEKNSIAALLDGKIRQSINHLLALRERIEDTSSKVLVTGDLNAGKSTFCNALLRRKLLPEDQQPCTSIFCEVLDARENSGIEEVHAVHKDVAYDRHDESTYDVYRLADLEEIVVDSDRYMQAKIYVKDVRGVDESLLNNGVIDIALIDAPGLNMDSLKTHAVFAREEEIDVVVFVVSAANHFTLSAKEFIWNAAREKAYIFIVVNGFDMIRDKGRCQRMILDQVANLSPRTFKESAELVHFVSSNAIPVISGSVPSEGGGSYGADEDPWDNDNGDNDGDDNAESGENPEDDDPKGKRKQTGRSERNPGSDKHRSQKKKPDKGKQREQRELQRHDFERLEQSLRRFVLEKRARSKLAPAKTYLQNVLGDLASLANVNRDVAQSELDRVSRELSTLEPAYERSRRAQAELSDELERSIDEQATLTYERTRETLTRAIDRIAQAADAGGVQYPGAWRALQYADELRAAMLEQVTAAVVACEQTAREQASEGVSGINALGDAYLGSDYSGMAFRSDLMFRRKRDALARQVDAPIELWDFIVDPATLFLQLPGCSSDRGDAATNKTTAVGAAGTGMAMTAVGLLGSRLVSGGGVAGFGWFDGALGAARLLLRTRDIRKLILPGIILTGT
jgi:mitofusin